MIDRAYQTDKFHVFFSVYDHDYGVKEVPGVPWVEIIMSEDKRIPRQVVKAFSKREYRKAVDYFDQEVSRLKSKYGEQ